MKKKILLFVSLVLMFAVQGWTTPVDSTDTQSSGNGFTKLNGVELIDASGLLNGLAQKKKPNGFNPTDFTPSWINPKYNKSITWTDEGEWMIFTFMLRDSEAILGVDTVFYLLAEGMPNCIYDSSLKVEMIEGHGVFEFQTAVIHPEDVNGEIWEKDMVIKFHPTTIGQYKARFRITGSNNNVSKDMYLLLNVVEEHQDLTIHITPPSRNIPFYNKVGSTVTQQFMVTAQDLTSPLSMNIVAEGNRFYIGDDDLEDLAYLYVLHHAFDHEMYTIEGPSIITPEEAAQGAIVTIKYTPTTSGIHYGKLVISGDGLSENVHFTGFATKSQILLSDSTLRFPDAIKDESYEKKFTIKGIDLTNDSIHLDLTGDMFFIWWESYPASMVEQGVTVWVKYEPTECGMHEGTITISGGGAIESKTVHLIGSTPGDPSLTVTPSSYNFETINLGDSRQQTFTVKGNNLNERISITPMETIGGDYSFTPEYLPSTGGDVTITYKPINTGSTGAVFTLSSGDVSTTIDVVGTCAIPPTITRSVTSLNFGTVINGQTVDTTFTVTGTNLTGDLTLSSSYSYFTVSPSIITAADAANGKTVTVTYKPTASGTHNGTITISGGGAESKTVGLMGTCMDPNIYVSNTSLNFGTVNTGSQSDPMTFTVRGSDLTGDLTITKTGSNCSISVSPTIITANKAASGATVTVKCTPTNAGSFSGTIKISGGDAAPKTVSISGKCAAISTNPTSYNFGNVAVGKPVTKEIIVTGTNLTSAMSITLAETEGGQYSINKTTLPASGGTVIVTFKPTDAKSFGASLNISGGSAAAVSVCLSGKGVTPTITKNKSTLTFTGSSITSDYVKVTGTNLDDVISLTVTGSTNFTVSPSTISISDAADGKQVKVTCNPKNASSAEATLKITSPYASTKYVTLKYSRGSSGGGEVQVSAVQPEGGDEDTNNEFTNGGLLETTLNSTTDVSELAMNSKVYAEGLNIIIESPVEQKAVISDISGRARSVNLQAGRNEIPVNASGIYIVRIREKTTKLMLK